MRRFVRLPRPPRWLVIVLASLAFVLGGTAAAAYGYDQATNDRILPGVHIAGIDVSGMTRDQALGALDDRVRAAMKRHVTIHAGKKEWTRTLTSMGMTADPVRAVDEAFGVSGSLSWMSRVYHRLTDHPVQREIALPFGYDRTAIASFVEQVVAPAVAVKPQDAAIELDGDSLVMQHARLGRSLKPLVSARLIYSAIKVRKPHVDLPILSVQPKVAEDTMGKTIAVDLSTNTLRLYDGMQIERTYPVATAMYGFTTPVGEWEVVNKVENPTWVNPGSAWAASEPPTIPPGPDNPLGTRALYLSASGIRIHGTPSDSSIGTYASHGCIRMHIPDSEAMYPLVPVGTKVVIYGAPPWGNIDFGTVAGT
jgi:lipoprotein-anchoring transpeptidase ErfK/SrfK